MEKHPLPFSIYSMLANKVLGRSIDDNWQDWAIEMMEAGFESDHLFMLAGMSKPFNQFEMQDLTDKVLADFGLRYDDGKTVLGNYASFLIQSSLGDESKYLKTLRELHSVYLHTQPATDYLKFYLLYLAKEDLEQQEVQWYWPNADRSNINAVIREEFEKWLGG